MSDDAPVTHIPVDAATFHEGYLAGRRGLTGKDNPYPIGTGERLTWHLGLVKGRTKRLKIVDGSRPCD